MGMDLIPIDPTPEAPRNPEREGTPLAGHYNWQVWRWLVGRLRGWGVDVSEFSAFNDGDVISADTCRKVADAIEAHLGELKRHEIEWLAPGIILWRTCGGYRQF